MTGSDHRRILPAFALFAALMLPMVTGAEQADEEQLEQQLVLVRQQIASLQTSLQNTRVSRNDELAELRSVEKEVGAISLAIKSAFSSAASSPIANLQKKLS